MRLRRKEGPCSSCGRVWILFQLVGDSVGIFKQLNNEVQGKFSRMALAAVGRTNCRGQ